MKPCNSGAHLINPNHVIGSVVSDDVITECARCKRWVKISGEDIKSLRQKMQKK